MKIIPVVCAIIEREGKVLCARRSPIMALPLKWEFPGGKLEQNESPEDALSREIEEELGVKITVLESLTINEHSYHAGIIIRLMPYRCRLSYDGNPQPKEHAELKWVAVTELTKLDWAEADVPIVNDYITRL